MGIINYTQRELLSSRKTTQTQLHYVMQANQAAPQPVSFDLPLDKDLTANPPIRQRLEQREETNPLTLEQIQEKLEQAEKRKAQVIASQISQLNGIQEKAKTHNKKVQQIVQSKAEETKEELDTKKAKFEDKMSRASSFESQKLENAKAYNEKHQQKVEGYQTEQQKELEDKKTKIEDKLSKAAERRDEVITQVKQTAAQSAVLKQSPKKAQQEL